MEYLPFICAILTYFIILIIINILRFCNCNVRCLEDLIDLETFPDNDFPEGMILFFIIVIISSIVSSALLEVISPLLKEYGFWAIFQIIFVLLFLLLIDRGLFGFLGLSPFCMPILAPALKVNDVLIRIRMLLPILSVLIVAFVFFAPTTRSIIQKCNAPILHDIDSIERQVAKDEGNTIIGPFKFGMTKNQFRDSLQTFLERHNNKILIDDVQLFIDNKRTLFVDGRLRRLVLKTSDLSAYSDLYDAFSEKYMKFLELKDSLIQIETRQFDPIKLIKLENPLHIVEVNQYDTSIALGHKTIEITEEDSIYGSHGLLFLKISQTKFLASINKIDIQCKEKIIQKQKAIKDSMRIAKERENKLKLDSIKRIQIEEEKKANEERIKEQEKQIKI